MLIGENIERCYRYRLPKHNTEAQSWHDTGYFCFVCVWTLRQHSPGGDKINKFQIVLWRLIINWLTMTAGNNLSCIGWSPVSAHSPPLPYSPGPWSSIALSYILQSAKSEREFNKQ